MADVDLEPVEATIAAYRVFTFSMNFYATEDRTRGILDIHISRADKPDDAWTLSMVVPNNMTTKEGYQRHIEAFFKERFGIRDREVADQK